MSIELRPYEFFPEHLDWLNDKSLMRYSEQRHVTHTRESVEAYVGEASIFLTVWAADRPVGTIAGHADWRNAILDLGMLIGVPGMGYGLEAWQMALFQPSCFRKITAGAMRANVPMVKIMQKTMKYEYTRPGYFLFEGQPMDSVHYAL